MAGDALPRLVSVLVDIDSINAALKAKLFSWLPQLIGGAEDKQRKMWIAGHKASGWIGSSLEVTTSGANTGVWVHYGAAGGRIGGDALGLVNYIKFGGADMKAAFAYARDTILRGDVIELTAEERKRIEQQRVKEDREAAERKKKREGFARRIFLYEAQPELLGTPVEFYFRDQRAISLRRLPYAVHSLRFHPALEHPQLKRKLPAMVAAVVLEGATVGIHRTWLLQRNGKWDRVRGGEQFEGFYEGGLEVEGKLSLGTTLGGAIRLWPGQRSHEGTGEVRKGFSWRDAPEGSSIGIAEAIEEGMTLVAAMSGLRIAVPTAVSGFKSMDLPPQFSKVTLFGNRDAPGSDADKALRKGLEHRRAEGREASIVQPPVGFKDWNAWWVSLVNKARRAG